MHLGKIIQRIEPTAILGKRDLEIKGLANHSREIKPGYLFFCLPGFKDDGHRYLKEAYARGAIAAVTQKKTDLPLTQIVVKDPRQVQARISQEFFAHPSQKLELIGITGTNGKTTTSYMTESILQKAGIPCGVIVSINSRFANLSFSTNHTTPDAIELATFLSRMVSCSIKTAVMEVSSHSLEMKRVAECNFSIAVLTNITRDHFDFHKNYNRYVKAKSLLFSEQCRWSQTPENCRAIINIDDPASPLILSKSPAQKKITFGFQDPADIQGLSYKLYQRSSELVLKTPREKLKILVPFPGYFNLYNALASVAIAYSLKINPEIIKMGISTCPQVPGRVEFIDCGQDFNIIVDFAHNPAALFQVLTLPTPSTGKKILVFGCEGEKDRGKRFMMGHTAARWADYTIITTDNSYGEEPEKIAHDIEKGFLSYGRKQKAYQIILNRKEAINKSLVLAKTGDTVIIAGKGNESRQVTKDISQHFDDREIIREVISK